MEENNQTCPLCGRPLAEPYNRHHWLPLSKGGKDTPTVLMHKICHGKIHATFTESELKNYYNTAERMLENEEVSKFVKWVKKKDPTFYDGSVSNKKK